MLRILLVTAIAMWAHAVAGDDLIAVQSNWSGGGGVEGPVVDWSDTFAEAASISWRSQPGRLTLAAVPLATSIGQPLSDDSEGAIKIYASDVDLDGDTDILGVSYWGDRIELFLNDGNPLPGWDRQVIAEGFARALAVSVADIDGDGLPDILAGSDAGSEVSWWKNGGGHPILWTRHDVDDDVPGAHDVLGSDLDGDGDNDIVGVSYENDMVLWWRNDGGDPLQWTRLEIATGFDYPTKVDVGDVDGDGILDVAAVAWLGERLSWWRSDGGSPPVWTEQTIGTGFTGAHWIRLADIDGDGYLDAVGAAMDRSEVAWWRNGGSDPIQWQKSIVTGSLPGAVSTFPADLDGDGDLDVAASGWSSAGGVMWWENRNGVGTDWLQRTVDRSFGETSSIHIADVDGNGTLDVLASSWNLNSLAWWQTSEPVDAGTITSSIFDAGGPVEWTTCHWTDAAPIGADVRIEVRVSDNPSSMGDWWLVSTGDLSGTLQRGTRYLQYRAHLVRGSASASPVVYDVSFSGLELESAAPRRPSRRIAP